MFLKIINFSQSLQFHKYKKIIFFIFIFYILLRLLPIILNEKILFIDEIYSLEKFKYDSWFQNLIQTTPVHYLISKFFLIFSHVNIYFLTLPYLIISIILFIVLIKNKFFVTSNTNILFFLLFTISLPAIYYSSFIGHYGPFFLFLLLSHIYLVKCLKNKLRHIIKFFFFSFFTILSHQVGIFFFIINIIFLSFYNKKIIVSALIILSIGIFFSYYLLIAELLTLNKWPLSYETTGFKSYIIYLFEYFYKFSNGSIKLGYWLERVLIDHPQNNYSIYNYFFFFKAVVNFYLFGQTSFLSTIYFLIFLTGFVSAIIKFFNNKNNKIELVHINSNYFLFLIIFTFTFFYIFRFKHTFEEKYLMYLNIPVLFFFTKGIIIILQQFKKKFKFKKEISLFFVVFIFLNNFELYKKANTAIYIKDKHFYSFNKALAALAKIDNDVIAIVRDTDYSEFSLNNKIFNYKFQILMDVDFINLKEKIGPNKKLYWLSIPDIETMKINPLVNVIKNYKAGNINIYEIKKKN